MLCTRNTANEYLDKNETSGNVLTRFILEHNSNNANDPVRTNGKSYHKEKLNPFFKCIILE